MRTSRISQDTTRALSSIPVAPPTRRTRSSLARFGLSAVDDTGVKDEDVVDIEDVVSATTTADAEERGKRKRGVKRTTNGKLKKEDHTDSDAASDSSLSPAPSTPPPTGPRRVRQPLKRIKSSPSPSAGPPNWEKTYALLKRMRTTGIARDAPVDTMGCHALAQPHASPRDRRFQTLIALMLSSQTKDTTNYVVMQGLYTNLPAATHGGEAGLNLENILAVSAERLNELIWAVGFHNNKTKYIKAAAEILRDRYAGDIPDTAEGLMALPGVGPKMAYLCLSAAWGKIEGIGVDVHVHRITNLWGWHGAAATKGPEETRAKLEGWVPREKWTEINWLLVGFGQMVCFSEKGRRMCGECEVGLAGFCKAADRGKVAVGRRAGGWVKVGDGEWVKGGGEGVKVEYEVNGGTKEEEKKEEEKKDEGKKEEEIKDEMKAVESIKDEKLPLEEMKDIKINWTKEEADEKKVIKEELHE